MTGTAFPLGDNLLFTLPFVPGGHRGGLLHYEGSCPVSSAGKECTKKMPRLIGGWGAGLRNGLAAPKDTDLELQVQSGSEMWNIWLTMKPSKRADEET